MIRIASGEFRGRWIKTPDSATRPTSARLRSAWLNSIQTEIPDARVLDAFAGSGALGFEALSRGAATAVFVENARNACQLIEENAETLGVRDRIRVHCADFEAWTSKKNEEVFDLIFADPPYRNGWETRILERTPWERFLVSEGLFCLEWVAEKKKPLVLPERTGLLVKIREKNYGESILTTYRKIHGEI